jgi:hypothetical protein
MDLKIKLDEGMPALWKSAMYACVLTFSTSGVLFVTNKGIDSITLPIIGTALVYIFTLALFWAGDIGMLHLTEVFKEKATEGGSIDKVSNQYVFSDYFLAFTHILALLGMGIFCFYGSNKYFYASLFLAGMNGVWLITKIYQFNEVIRFTNKEFRSKLIECRNTMQMWIAINSVYSAIMSGILFASPSPSDLAIIATGLTMLRSIMDFATCQTYYLKVAKRKYTHAKLMEEYCEKSPAPIS